MIGYTLGGAVTATDARVKLVPIKGHRFLPTCLTTVLH